MEILGQLHVSEHGNDRVFRYQWAHRHLQSTQTLAHKTRHILI